MASKDANILNLECGAITGKPLLLLSLKNYVYETVNGKRKRSSPYVFNEMGEISEIKQRAIIGKVSLKLIEKAKSLEK